MIINQCDIVFFTILKHTKFELLCSAHFLSFYFVGTVQVLYNLSIVKSVLAVNQEISRQVNSYSFAPLITSELSPNLR